MAKHLKAKNIHKSKHLSNTKKQQSKRKNGKSTIMTTANKKVNQIPIKNSIREEKQGITQNTIQKTNNEISKKTIKKINKQVIDRRKQKTIILIIIQIIFIIMFIIAGIYIVKWYVESKANHELSQELSQAVTVENTQEGNNSKYTVDFNKLKEKSKNIVAWLQVNGTDIEYAVAQTNNNEYYLKHDVEDNSNQAGWVFADYKNKLDGTDKNIVVYGHNMKNGTMFGTLKNILSAEWYNNEQNRYINFITENETYIYEVFSVYQIENEDYYIQTTFSDSTFTKFINTIKSRSIKKFNVDVTNEDNILTLSTCAGNNKYRVVLHAKKIQN